MSLRDTLRTAETLIASQNIPDARVEAELLLMHSLGIRKVELYASLDRPLSASEAERFRGLLDQRLHHEPSAYILKECQFYGIDFYIDPRALIPRPESELLVELALEYTKQRFPSGQPCLLADVGTGSGAIAVALALHVPQSEVYALDVSPAALDVARVNCGKHQVEERVHLLHGDMLGPLPKPVHIILANLPYVTDSELPQLAPEIRDFEPTIALAGGASGLDHVRRFLPQAREKTLPGGMVLMEVGQGQGKEARSLAEGCFYDAEIDLVPDLAGIGRVVRVLT